MKKALSFVATPFVLFVLFVSFVAPSFVIFVAAQSPPRDVAPVATTGTAVIRGGVVQADTGQPIPGATIRVEGSRGPAVPDRTTDGRGRFEIAGLPAGQYSLIASKGGYVALRSGQRLGATGPPAASITLADGQAREVGDLALPRGAVIAGRVLDERGNEVTGAIVQALTWRWDRGVRYTSNENAPITDQTDDLGEFRLFGLATGTYILAVTAISPSGFAWLNAYYPSTYSAPEAAGVTVKAGQEVTGLTVTVDRTLTARLSGVVRRGDGLPPGSISVYAERLPDLVRSVGPLSASVRADGSYAFTNLPLGEYLLTVEGGSEGHRQFAGARVELDGTLTVNLTMRGPKVLRGRYLFDSGGPASDLKPLGTRRISAGSVTSLDGRPFFGMLQGSWTTNADWTFEADGFGGRLYRLNSPPVPSGWTVKRITRGDVDVTDGPLDFDGDIEGLQILLTQRITRVSASVARTDGTTAGGAAVVVFPEDEGLIWPYSRYMRYALRPDASGRYTFTALPPARYLAVAVENLEPGEETNPALLRRLREVATKFSLEEGETRSIELNVITGP